MAHPRASLDLVARAEAAGADEAWIPETWGFDAPSLMGAIAARTERISIGAVLPVYSRSPALIAQTIAGADASRFDIQSDGCSGASVAPLGTCTIQVNFLHPPGSSGAFDAELRFLLPSSGYLSIPLRATIP